MGNAPDPISDYSAFARNAPIYQEDENRESFVVAFWSLHRSDNISETNMAMDNIEVTIKNTSVLIPRMVSTRKIKAGEELVVYKHLFKESETGKSHTKGKGKGKSKSEGKR